MAEFKVNTAALYAQAAELAAAEGVLAGVQTKLEYVKLSGALHLSSTMLLNIQLTQSRAKVAGEVNRLHKMYKVLREAAELYERVEKDVAKPKSWKDMVANGGAAAAIGAATGATVVTGTASEAAADKKSTSVWDRLVKAIGGIGLPGAVIGSIYNYAKGDAKSIVSGTKYVTSVISSIAGIWNSAGEAVDWKEWVLGWKSSSPAGGFMGAMREELGKYKFGSGTSKNVKATAKWAGLVLTLAGNGISNYQEYKKGDISAERAVGETIIETAYDIGTTMVIKSVLTATIGTNPAVIVTGFAVVGIDWACEKMFGRKPSEIVADAVMDITEDVIDGTKKLGKYIRGGVRELEKNINGGVKAAWNWIVG